MSDPWQQFRELGWVARYDKETETVIAEHSKHGPFDAAKVCRPCRCGWDRHELGLAIAEMINGRKEITELTASRAEPDAELEAATVPTLTTAEKSEVTQQPQVPSRVLNHR